MENNDLENQKSMRRFLLGKYSFEIGTLVVILTAILVASHYNFIDNCTAGTLFGSTIGFFASSIRKIHE